MAGVDPTWADHGAFSTELARLKHLESLLGIGILDGLYGLAKACGYELAGCADSRAAATGHADPDIRLHSGQFLIPLLVEEIEVDP